MLLENKVAIITGAARGIGYAIAKRYVEEGARVVIADSDDKQGSETAEELSVFGETCYVHTDVSKRLDVRNLVTATVEAFGDIDILVNNAGIVHSATFLELKEDDFDRVLEVNLKGTFLCGRAVARHMVENVEAGKPAGSIINLSSVDDNVVILDQLAYAVSKGGVRQLTRAMAMALARYSIRVNAIGPGTIFTEMFKTISPEATDRRAILARTPLGRFGEPREIAAIAVFLASQDASYITGETIYADGGRLGLNYVTDSNSTT